MRNLRILVAPLDWGLGHATRCIPIIEELINQGCEVMLAGEGEQEILLKKEFPMLPFFSLPGYRIRYSVEGSGMVLKMIKQLPRLQKAIKFENHWLKQKVIELGIDAVISDNRYGLYHKKIPCVFMTHQLTIKSPWKWTERLLQKLNYHYINRFTECWVPDFEEKDNLAGELSHPLKKPGKPVFYTGILSRFKNTGLPEKKKQLLIILSGPEPQRSIFENMIIHQISTLDVSATVLRGLPSSNTLIPSTDSIHFHNHLSSEELNKAMEVADFVISRSGYSTLMEAMALKKKCILVPTPGQTEQEYLAKYFAEMQYSIYSSQKNFSIIKMLRSAENFSYRFPSTDSKNNLKELMRRFLTHFPISS